MDHFKRLDQGSFRTMFYGIEDQLHLLKNAARGHFDRWSDIAREYQLPFQLEVGDALGGSGKVLGKSYSVRPEFCLSGSDVTAEILIIGTDADTNDPVLIDSYYLGFNREIRSKTDRSLLTHKSDLMVSEHQAICEVLFSVAERQRIK